MYFRQGAVNVLCQQKSHGLPVRVEATSKGAENTVLKIAKF